MFDFSRCRGNLKESVEHYATHVHTRTHTHTQSHTHIPPCAMDHEAWNLWPPKPIVALSAFVQDRPAPRPLVSILVPPGRTRMHSRGSSLYTNTASGWPIPCCALHGARPTQVPEAWATQGRACPITQSPSAILAMWVVTSSSGPGIGHGGT